jgi:hypothetical protein
MTTEAAFQGQVVELARMTGWKTMHVRRSVGKGHRWTTSTSVVGWPDLILWRPGRIIAAELKSDTGQVTCDQALVLASLEEAGMECHVWRPRDLDEIAGVLGRRPRLEEAG